MENDLRHYSCVLFATGQSIATAEWFKDGDALHPLNAGEWVMREECSNTTREGTLKWWGFNPRARMGRDV